jgi:primosomal protein N' (replication factor Y)
LPRRGSKPNRSNASSRRPLRSSSSRSGSRTTRLDAAALSRSSPRQTRAPQDCRSLPSGRSEASRSHGADVRQERALARLARAYDDAGGHFLLYGATGSGKTEVYLQAAATALDRDLGVIVLVPEIALAPQTVGRFRARFGDRVAILHSSLSEAERRDERERIA